LLHAITPKIEGLHEVKCILESGSQIVSISEAVWQTLNRELNPRWKVTMQSANGSHNESLGLVENLDVLTTSYIKNYRDESQTITTITDPNSGKMVSIPTVPRGQPRFKSPPPEDIHQESFEISRI
jgi:hypothetical protein